MICGWGGMMSSLHIMLLGVSFLFFSFDFAQSGIFLGQKPLFFSDFLHT